MKQLTFRLICFILLATQLPVINLAQTQTDSNSQLPAIGLELDKSIERELKGGEAHIYSIKLDMGYLARIAFDRMGINVAVSLFATDGTLLATTNYMKDSPLKHLIMVATIKRSGFYVLQIRSLENQTIGRYKVDVRQIVVSRTEIKQQEILKDSIRNFASLLANTEIEEERIRLLKEEPDLINWMLVTELHNFTNRFIRQSNYSQALVISRFALELAEQIQLPPGFIADAYFNVAHVYYLQNNDVKALDYCQKNINIIKPFGDTRRVIKSLSLMGSIYNALGKFDKTHQFFEEAFATIESSRNNIGNEDSRISYFSTMQQPYKLYIDLLMQRDKEEPSFFNNKLAFEASERSRARSLLELLNEANTDIRQGVDPQLLNQERSLQQQLNERAEQQTRLLSGRHTPEQAAALKKEIDALTFEYRNNQAQIRLKSPRYAALTQPQPLKLSEIQKDVLDADTILLEYALGEKRSYLWAVTKDSIKSYELPPRSEIEATVRRVYALLSDGKKVIDEKAQDDYETEAARLSRILLAPVAAQIQNKQIVIVADGALQYLPFGALPSPNSKENSRQPLIAENEIVSLPSASTLAVLRRQVKGRRAASKTVAVIADPVFDSTDARVKPAAKNNPDRQKPQTSSSKRNFIFENAAFNTGIMRDGIISRLPFSRREAESILTAVSTGEKLQALDFEANRETVLKPEMSQYRIVHFATHGLLNSENPELSGIVLSLVNEQGKSVDGFLRLNEIYNLNLSADLVVLSACQTALGKEIRGEGLIGLTRGFMYAGSPRVVASLWKVDDAATAELMKLFYQKMLKDKLRPAAALRAAKIEMWKQKRWNAPFYWAAFELQGEWR